MTFGDGVPVSFTSPGRLFFGLLDWLRNDFSSAHLCRLLENGDLVLAARPVRNVARGQDGLPPPPERDDRLEAGPLSRRPSRSARCQGGRPGPGGQRGWGGRGGGRRGAPGFTYGRDRRDRRPLRRRGASPGRFSGARRRNNRYDIQALCEAFAGLLGDRGRADTDFDRKAREVLLGRLSEIREEGRRPALALKEALDLLRTTGASLRVGASPPLPGHLHVSGFSTGGHSGRPVTFVVGLDEATFPGRGLQDPVLLDDERAALSDALPTSADGLLSGLFGLASALASVRGRVVFSYPSFDVVEGRESFPSSVVLQAFRLQRGAPGLDYGALEREIADAAGFLPGGVERSFDEIDWWLERLAGRDPVPDGAGSIPANFPDLAAGLAAAAARAGDTLTEFDGIVDIGPLREEIDPLAGDKAVMSASRLELLAKCPFAYFLRHVLKVEAPEEVAFDRARWLDPLQRGSLIHAILCDFMTRVRDRGEAVAAGRHAGLMDEISAAALARMKEEIPPPSDAVYESETRDIRDSLSIFLAAEENLEEKGEPIEFEMEIAKRRIELGRDRSFFLRGTIDRVDRLGPDTYRILDYKTGSAFDYEELVEFGGGQKIQHALYAVALEKMLAERPGGGTPRVTRSGYLFPSRRGEGLARIIKDFDRDRLEVPARRPPGPPAERLFHRRAGSQVHVLRLPAGLRRRAHPRRPAGKGREPRGPRGLRQARRVQVMSAKKSLPPDQPARDRIVRDLDTTFLVEAGAGSGKTKSLVDRMIALLATGRTEIGTLAAVTFTRKAAAQLRGGSRSNWSGPGWPRRTARSGTGSTPP
ncbi:MAG: PD-(D/E)XK nuclease family protein [Candidatus Moduliflexus flocculans]|nr:PD-(D/E)XK nuclease family protein [Candidatus Moduliflexus flocculans]